jgi:hypothetical protein
MSAKKPKKAAKDPDAAPWTVAGIRGVVPPGRRLGAPTEKRPLPWNASGVVGVTPPGNLKPGEGPATRWILKHQKGAPPPKPVATKAPPRKLGRPVPGEVVEPKPIDAGRPTAGFVPDPAAGTGDPASLKLFLDEITEFFAAHTPADTAEEDLDMLIRQSQTPYEIIVAFTILAALVGEDQNKRNRFGRSLQRGAKAYYNLAQRLDKKVRPPRGLAPQTLDPIFYDLPQLAYQLPFAFATDAFSKLLDMVRGSIAHERLLIRAARDFRRRFIEGRSLGDKALSAMFPWTEPEWAPEDS